MLIAREGTARVLAGEAEARRAVGHPPDPCDAVRRRAGRHRDAQLEVLTAGRGELRRRDAELRRHVGDAGRERQRRELDLDPGAAARGEVAGVGGDAVAEVDERVRPVMAFGFTERQARFLATRIPRWSRAIACICAGII